MSNYIFPFLWMRGEAEEVIREEIEKIYECGIRAVCVEARPHDDFCGPGWWHDMDIVIDEAKKRDMKIWILDDKHFPTGYAAGLIETKYPERNKWYLADTTADVFGGQHPYTLNIGRMLKPVIGYWQIEQFIGEGMKGAFAQRAQNQMLAIVAVKYTEENTFEEETLDLTEYYKDGFATFTLPEGQWRVHVLFRTQADGGNKFYINMMDEVSAHTQIEGVYESHYEHYGDLFGTVIAGFFSDEPEIGNTSEIGFDKKIGKKGMFLPWSDELEAMMKERYGDHYITSLPFLFEESGDMEVCPQVRYDFMDCVSRLYEKNFSKPIGAWCRAHGVEYIGHVVEDDGSHSRLGHGPGHWFRSMTGQDMAGIDLIGGQVIFGAPAQTRKGMGGMDVDGEFFHYILGKLGASAGHLDPLKKGRTMCELFGAYGWNFGVRNMKYLLDHALVKGINHLVQHAFSMANYPDIDCPPHFYARGNNAQFPWFAELMKYANRMCELLNHGTHVASVAVLYDGELDWAGDHMKMQKIGRELIENQIEFDVVPVDVLNNLSMWNGKMENGKMHINGVTFDALLIPGSAYAPYELAEFVKSNRDFPVYFVDGAPKVTFKNAAGAEMDESWLDNGEVVALYDLAEALKAKGMTKIHVKPAFSHLSVYHYNKDRQIVMLFNESAEQSFKGTVELPFCGAIAAYDGYADEYLNMAGEGKVELELEPGQSIVLVEKKELVCEKDWSSLTAKLTGKKVLDLSEGWTVELAKAKEYPVFSKTLDMKELEAVSASEPTFSGIIRYTKEVALDAQPLSAIFAAEKVYEVMRVTVNGECAGTCLIPPYQVEVQKYLKAGKNEIVVEVANTPGRDQMNYDMAPFDFSHEPMEPSGMFGNIGLYL